MDFRKIEWLFIFVFVGLNIFLYNIYQSSQSAQQAVTTTYNQKENLTERLKGDDITYSGEISNEKKEGYYLSAEQVNLVQANNQVGNQAIIQNSANSEDVLTNYLSQKKNFNIKKTNRSFNRLMRDTSFIFNGTKYKYLANISKKDKTSAKIIGTQSYEGIPFVDETSRVTLDIEIDSGDVKITQYSQALLTQIEPLREKMTLYSEAEILNTLYINNNIPSGSKIQNTYLGYFRTIEVGDKNVYVPVWFVNIKTSDNTSQVEKVNALNNQVITNNLVPKVENQ